MAKGGKGNYKHRHKVRKLACLALTVILIIIIVVLVVLYFTLFRPKDPRVEVPTMQLLSISAAGGGFPAGTTSSVNLTLLLQVLIHNPSRAPFHVRDGSTACLYYYGAQVGFIAIPTGKVPSRSTVSLPLDLTVQGSSPLQGPYLYGDVTSGVLQVGTSVTVIGKVTTLNIFSHHAAVVSKCNVIISLNSRSIVSFTCQKSFSLDI